LLRTGQYAGAYYLAGYAIECALKACIAKRTKRFDFPDKDFARNVWTHELESLVDAAAIRKDLNGESSKNPAFKLNWTTVKDWRETKRYDWRISKAEAKDFLSACTSRQVGVLGWIRKRW
jgi:hypothetical protein